MNKLEVQKRVLQFGKPLNLDKFTWDEKSSIFSSYENNLIIDFNDVSYCTFNTGSNCTFNTESNCTFDTGSNCTFNTESYCTFNTGYGCTFKSGYDCTFNTESYCTFSTASYCMFNTDSYCMFNTEHDCTFRTGAYCTIKSGAYCTIKSGYDCTFNTGPDCTFNIYKNGYFINNFENNVVIIRESGNKKVVELVPNNKFIEINLKGIVNEKEIKPFKSVDNSTMIIKSTKVFNNYTIYNGQYIRDYFNDKSDKVLIVEKDGIYAHCKNIKDGIRDIDFKIAYKLGAKENAKKLIARGKGTALDYRLCTGACEFGTKHYLDELGFDWSTEKTINEMIELTKGQYGHEVFVKVLKECGYVLGGRQ